MRIMDKYGKILFALLLCLTFVGCQIDNAKLSAGESIADIEYKQLPVGAPSIRKVPQGGSVS